MKRLFSVLSGTMALATCAALWSPRAKAADPTTADCLAAAEASLKSGNGHRLRTARSQLLVCAASACPADIRKECIRRVADVNAAMPTIVFEAKDDAGKDLSAVKVTMDGQPLADRLEGTALSIDPGEHAFTFETAGQPPLQKQFVIREAEKDRRERITFGATQTGTVSQAFPPGAMQAALPVLAPETRSGLGTQKILAIVAGGVGVVGLGVGTVFAVMTMSKKNDAQSACPNQCANQNGVTLWNDARTTAQIADVAFIVGGVALAGGAALWLTAKPESAGAPSAQVSLGPGTVQLKGAW